MVDQKQQIFLVQRKLKTKRFKNGKVKINISKPFVSTPGPNVTFTVVCV